MKSLPPSLQSHLDTGTTTLAWCWRVTRNDGTAFGFTDHDRDLVFDGTTFEAATGFTASEIKDGLGLSVDNLEVSSALKSDRLNEDDLAAGLYDDAPIEIWRVNWADTEQRVLMRAGSLGETRRSGSAFTAEVRGLAHYLQQPKGRLFQSGCDADLGDIRCGVDLDDPDFRGSGTVLAAASKRQFTATGLDAFDANWFTRGLVTFTSGANTGLAQEVRRHAFGSPATLELWQPMAHAMASGDAFIVTAGCDKQFATCKSKFANGVNFRGFPHMPGNDFVIAVARPGDTTNSSGSGSSGYPRRRHSQAHARQHGPERYLHRRRTVRRLRRPAVLHRPARPSTQHRLRPRHRPRGDAVRRRLAQATRRPNTTSASPRHAREGGHPRKFS